MPQSSGPLATGTTSERQFTDVMWRALFGDEPGVVADMDGSAYKLGLAVNSDVVSVGSSTQDSIARVAGFMHRIPKGETEPITIPAATGTPRTDLITLRYDQSHTGAPGPVRLARIANKSATAPIYGSQSSTSAEDLPLWAITRQPGQSLSQAQVTRIFPRRAPVLELPAGAHMPYSSPIGTYLTRGDETYVRTVNAQGVAVWTPRGVTSDSDWVTTGISGAAGWTVIATGSGAPSAYRLRDGWVTVNVRAQLNAGQAPLSGGSTGNIGGDPIAFNLPVFARTTRTVYTTFNVSGVGTGGGRFNTDGSFAVVDYLPNQSIGPGQWIDVYQTWPVG